MFNFFGYWWHNIFSFPYILWCYAGLCSLSYIISPLHKWPSQTFLSYPFLSRWFNPSGIFLFYSISILKIFIILLELRFEQYFWLGKGEFGKIQCFKDKIRAHLSSKSYSSFVCFDDNAIEPSTINILGINISHFLSWKQHITFLGKSASRKLGNLYKCKNYRCWSSLHPTLVVWV